VIARLDLAQRAVRWGSYWSKLLELSKGDVLAWIIDRRVQSGLALNPPRSFIFVKED